MLSVDRSDEPPPACLSDSRTAEARHALFEVFTHRDNIAQTRISFERFAIDEPDLREALNRLFRGRCAFCETQTETMPYRFRPTEEAGPSSQAPAQDQHRSHLYYTWLTNTWRNIYPICRDCRPKEPSLFPVYGKRAPLPNAEEVELYYRSPTGDWRGDVDERPIFVAAAGREDLRKHFAPLPDGVMMGIGERGEATIAHFDLNRHTLVDARRSAIGLYFDQLLHAQSRAQCDAVMDFERMPYGGGWFLHLYQLARLLGYGGERQTLSFHRIASYFRDRVRRKDFSRRLLEARDQLARDPDQIKTARLRRSLAPAGTARPVAFKLENFKSIEAIGLEFPKQMTRSSSEGEPLAPCLIILGENAAGKSSILEAMALAMAEENVRADEIATAAPFLLDPRLMGADRPGKPRPGSVTVTYDDNARVQLTFGPDGFASDLIPPQAEPRIPVFAYGAYRLFTSNDETAASATIRSLFDPSYKLVNPEDWLGRIRDTPLFDEVIRALRFILGIGQAFHTIAFDEKTGRCMLVIKIDRAGQYPIFTRTPLSAVSSGFRAVLGMACDVMRHLVSRQNQVSATLAKSRAVVLVDEIEAHLHPRWKLRIMQGLRDALPNVTFIVTTHDPLCLRGMDDSEVKVLRRVAKTAPTPSAPPTLVEQIEDLPPVGALTVEQLLTSELFQLFTTDDLTVEASLAGVGDLLARETAGSLRPSDQGLLDKTRERIRKDVGESLPIGSTEVQRLVQEAVEKYLRERQTKPGDGLKKLREDTLASIVQALKGL